MGKFGYTFVDGQWVQNDELTADQLATLAAEDEAYEHGYKIGLDQQGLTIGKITGGMNEYTDISLKLEFLEGINDSDLSKKS